jgi:hypothetical protein
LNLALRILAADHTELRNGQQRRKSLLAQQQEQDGSWPANVYHQLGRYPLYFGSAALTTLFAIRALSTDAHPGPIRFL